MHGRPHERTSGNQYDPRVLKAGGIMCDLTSVRIDLCTKRCKLRILNCSESTLFDSTKTRFTLYLPTSDEMGIPISHFSLPEPKTHKGSL